MSCKHVVKGSVHDSCIWKKNPVEKGERTLCASHVLEQRLVTNKRR